MSENFPSNGQHISFSVYHNSFLSLSFYLKENNQIYEEIYLTLEINATGKSRLLKVNFVVCGFFFLLHVA